MNRELIFSKLPQDVALIGLIVVLSRLLSALKINWNQKPHCGRNFWTMHHTFVLSFYNGKECRICRIKIAKGVV